MAHVTALLQWLPARVNCTNLECYDGWAARTHARWFARPFPFAHLAVTAPGHCWSWMPAACPGHLRPGTGAADCADCPPDYADTVGKDHGRIEIRRGWTTGDPDREWCDRASLIRVECERRCGDRVATDTRGFIPACSPRSNPPIRAFYTRLCAKGKLKKVALVAAMRKLLTVLNAVSRDQVPWQLEPASTALHT